MPDVREKQREARRKIIRQWAKLPKDKRQSMEGISNSPGPPLSRTRKHSSAVVAIRMRRSWDGYCRVLISERLSSLHILRRRRRVLQLDPMRRTARVIRGAKSVPCHQKSLVVNYRL